MVTHIQNTPSSLNIAYAAVVSLGYTHSKLKETFIGVNYPTLRSIRANKTLKKGTEQFYLSLFIDLIHKEYNRRISNGEDGSKYILVVMKNILLAIKNEWEVKR